jgi:hypothetical protein
MLICRGQHRIGAMVATFPVRSKYEVTRHLGKIWRKGRATFPSARRKRPRDAVRLVFDPSDFEYRQLTRIAISNSDQ